MASGTLDRLITIKYHSLHTSAACYEFLDACMPELLQPTV